MEGPVIRNFPRMALDTPIELRLADRSIRIPRPRGNLSAGGLFVHTRPLPLGSQVQVRIAKPEPFQVAGVVRYVQRTHGRGVGIEFARLTPSQRRHLDSLIRELTRRGVPAY
jgi:hypothetical protein